MRTYKNVRKALALLSLIAVAASNNAQNKLYLWQNGTPVEYMLESVDSITFSYKEQQGPDINQTTEMRDAKTIAKSMFTGINIGNTLEAVGDWCPDGETCWGSPKITPQFMKMYKEAGFNTIRIPVAWNTYTDSEGNIKQTWMNRVKEVVDYAMAEDLFVMLNIHWDNGWLETNITKDKQNEVNARQAKLWQQIATTFADYDDKLLFASANEPNAGGNNDAETIEKCGVLKSYHQTFINTVRNSGGNNGQRVLIIQGPNTDVDLSLKYDVMPTDVVDGRLMFEVHYYPYTYALMETDADWSPAHYFWGKDYKFTINGKNRTCDWNNEQKVTEQFTQLKAKFFDKGIPVVLGEYAVMNRDLSGLGNEPATGKSYQELFEESRAYYYEYINKTAKNNGIVPVLWETPDNIFDRKTYKVINQVPLNGIMKGSDDGKYPW